MISAKFYLIDIFILPHTETVTVECKTRLHECVTCIEQAEIAVTELEQRNNTEVGGNLDSQREEIKGMSHFFQSIVHIYNRLS